MEITRYQDQHAEEWDRFVWAANNGTIFHTRRFLSYHPPGRFEDHSLVFKKRGRVLALLPAVRLDRGNSNVLSSHCGASYGGFVVRPDLSIRDAFLLVDALLDYAHGQKFDVVELTHPPQVYWAKPSNYIDFALFQRNFVYKKREISSVVPLNFAPECVLETFSAESRRAVRRALKLGVEVRPCDDYAQFYQILQKNLKMRHNVRPTHTVDELLTLKGLFPERIHLLGAFAEGRMIAGVVLFDCNVRTTLAFYISHDEDFQHYRPVNLLFYKIFQDAIRRGFSWFDFGIFTVNMAPNWGLGHFKEGFGAQGVFRDTFHRAV
ncbi:MAG: GNAT family N-acetyltransferase [candidate division KSB1 bacterium]|nr:GNAT family N-acetyltransferase [candidate division KSB1 bacterium]MDZ7339171.1 GNAT family N-acetyltransferase [candidate division KSB1 bacterium]MDZ7378066.1 GNAT family N-acetyltransferase [candidate division KSB1 bacterium]MDZ7385124.1 GNAT family N-acetyltransferase [candidate division KSB1 bacterium]